MRSQFPFVVTGCPMCHWGPVWGDYNSEDYQWSWWVGNGDEPEIIKYCPNCGGQLPPKNPITKEEYFRAHGWTLPR